LAGICLGVSALGLFWPGVPDLGASLSNFGVALALGFPFNPDWARFFWRGVLSWFGVFSLTEI
jgi:hypothetical protein